MGKRDLADKLLELCREYDLPEPVRELAFAAPHRRWRFDCAWPQWKVAVEMQGGGGAGRHGSSAGIEKDAEKLRAATLLGWRVLLYTGKDVGPKRSMVTLREISALLNGDVSNGALDSLLKLDGKPLSTDLFTSLDSLDGRLAAVQDAGDAAES